MINAALSTDCWRRIGHHKATQDQRPASRCMSIGEAVFSRVGVEGYSWLLRLAWKFRKERSIS
jgi:hypothetical protein